MLIDTILQGECSQVMAGLPDGCIDLVVTSPPYDQLRDYTDYTFDFEAIARQLYRVTKVGGVVVWIVGDQTVNGSESGTSFRQALYFMSVGFNLHDTMIWESNKPPLTHNRYEQEFVYMFILSSGGPNVFNPIKIQSQNAGAKNLYYRARTEEGSAMRRRQEVIRTSKEKIKGNIWRFSGGMCSTSDKIAFEHPAIFPEALARDHILSWSNPGDLILDPMCGSGTTCKMAKQLGRHYLGIDISQEYVDLARRRVANAKTPLFTL